MNSGNVMFWTQCRAVQGLCSLKQQLREAVHVTMAVTGHLLQAVLLEYGVYVLEGLPPCSLWFVMVPAQPPFPGGKQGHQCLYHCSLFLLYRVL